MTSGKLGLYRNFSKKILLFFLLSIIPLMTFASSGKVPSLGPVRLEFILFGLTLLGVALFHKHTFWVAVTGLTVILAFKLIFDPGFHFMEHMFGDLPMSEQFLDKEVRQGEWGIILNLLGLLLGFAILSKIFEESKVPEILPNYLPDDWKGPFLLLIFVFIMSAFLDNIAAALIGGTIALVVFRNKVHIGYLAAIVAASNAGGAGSVVGDTTTTMMWIGLSFSTSCWYSLPLRKPISDHATARTVRSNEPLRCDGFTSGDGPNGALMSPLLARPPHWHPAPRQQPLIRGLQAFCRPLQRRCTTA